MDPEKIDRFALVHRHNVHVSKPDTLEALTVGNGEFAYTVDVTGLQTFPEIYENGMPLSTQSQWGWHSFPNPENYRIDDVAEEFESCNNRTIPFAVQHREQRAGAASHWLRTNPHRLHLGILGLSISKEDGSEIQITDLEDIDQELDLWSGIITSNYSIEGKPVQVTVAAHPQRDLVSFRVESPLLTTGRIRIKLQFPYGNDCHTCAGYDWNQAEKHESRISSQSPRSVAILRTLDSTTYHVAVSSNVSIDIQEEGKHRFVLAPEAGLTSFETTVEWSDNKSDAPLPDYRETLENSRQASEAFWTNGGAIDFSGCTDPRASELERRVVLSQYLTRINCAGDYPPQETGLTGNSWYGKFHLEMHWWHGVHFALWDRLALLEKSLPWYGKVLHQARHTAAWQGFAGVRWQKMTGPNGRISPSNVGEFLVWQQPHPIYFAELVYRKKPDKAVLNQYSEIVFETAEFMASFAQLSAGDSAYHLCHPLIPAQEIFPPMETDDPPFELAYWHFALGIAQKWRERMGMERNEQWQEVIDKLTPLPVHNNLYLPCAGAVEAYTDDENRRDHPIVLGAFGMLPGSEKIDTGLMERTFDEIFRQWNWQNTWGWDYPMVAMTAARLGKPERAIDALFMDVQKNTYLGNGHNYQDKRLRLYLPGNGGLLTAVAMMAAGWDGNEKINPGFPSNGKWNIRWENLEIMP
ncbi:MAG: hypothetical protein KDC80_27095 [Saprospiraceae bacterium]|nr:hypothetical protein [Saprospiraceae bacterium]